MSTRQQLSIRVFRRAWRTPHPVFGVLILLWFVLGQGCALVHATHHQLIQQPDQPACMICAIAHAAGVRAALPVVPPIPSVQRERLSLVAAQAENLQPVSLPQSRAPPASLV